MNKSFQRTLSVVLFIVFYSLSCSSFQSLRSTTYIKANDAFILGDNEHNKFSVRVTNISTVDVTIWEYPINGGRHSPVILKPSSSSKIQVDKNTAIRIENKTADEVAVKLRVHGDLGLSMGYKNK